MKLWSKDSTNTSELVEQFTVGKDREFDLLLAPFDVLGSIAHAKMLASIGLLTTDEAAAIVEELKKIFKYENDQFLLLCYLMLYMDKKYLYLFLYIDELHYLL